MNGEEFDDLVSFFDGMARTTWLKSVHDTLKEITGSWEGKDILDVGCGTGRLLLRGAEEANKVVGVDLSSEMVKASIQQFFYHELSGKSEFLIADAENLPFDEDSFHLALSTCVMFLLPDPSKGIKEIRRVLRKDGQMAMFNPSEKMSQAAAAQYAKENDISGFERIALLKWSNVSTRRHRYTPDEMTKLLKELGFTEVTHKEVLGGLAIISKAKKQQDS
ncbi:class I SAM-dependent methyltransferase [Fictibacillus phosphorivorans]|uniref:class I SAM-dependent methyltransferase n=1 Tax=Fictibacillus phosphorivorans TaxID=1221500 RepID=UPI00203ADA2C|nr:class I SAM-dependent methyltransferase [Fictibacillus phosphorivorans]MCM3717221.1 class I SAM-dependent methyltransferase [Fictibacillus phosphorivorans]MCM3774908.1 class I SAM-dependent methyltransferase [Fictibacillus phosphorivorans]